MTRPIVLFLAGALAVGGSGASPQAEQPSRLTIIGIPTPPVRVEGYETQGVLAQLAGRGAAVRKINAAIRAGIPSDGHVACGNRGSYQAQIDRRLISASSVVFSAMLPTVDFYGCRAYFRWISVTRRLPSGSRVKLVELFVDPVHGEQVFAKAWRAALRRGERGCVRLDYQGGYGPGPSYFASFALTPSGLAAAPWLDGACNGISPAIVPWTVLRPYLSELGARLVAGIRRPRFGRISARPRNAAIVSVEVASRRSETRTSVGPNRQLTVRRPIRFRIVVDPEGTKRLPMRVMLRVRQGASTITRSATTGTTLRGLERAVIFSSIWPALGKKSTVTVELTSLRGDVRLDSVRYPVEFRAFPRPCPLARPRCG